jgi:integrase
MLFRLVRPMQRKGTRNRYYVKRIPTDVRRGLAEGLKLHIPVGDRTCAVIITPRTESVRLSLQTHDPLVVRERQAAVDAHLERVWLALRERAPVQLSHRQATALAGVLYRAWASEGRERTTAVEIVPGEGARLVPTNGHTEPEEWEGVLVSLDRLEMPQVNGSKDSEIEKAIGPLVDRLLLARGIRRVSPETRPLVLSAFLAALRDAFENRKRNSEGDYSPDAKSERFPEWKDPHSLRSPHSPPIIVKATPRVSLKGVVQAWWAEAKATGRKPSTHESYSNTMANLAAFLGHDDAGRVTKDDVIRFKDHRLASINPRTKRPVSAKTVKDSDLAGLKAVFGWAVVNGKMASNPAEGVTIKLGKRRRTRRGFTEAEAKAILKAALHVKRGGERPGTFAAKRWVPWLCAYTGARVGEMAQLRKEDLRLEGEHWVITITPEAGTVKTDEARDVVLHSHLVEMGFPEFVQKALPGHLFLSPASPRTTRRVKAKVVIPDSDDGRRSAGTVGPLRGLKNRLAEFARGIVADPKVDPNHGWRHSFKTTCRDAGIDAETRDAIQGHKPRTEGESYGEFSLRAQAAAMAKFPRYEVD